MEGGEASRLGRNFAAVAGSLFVSQLLTLVVSLAIGRILGKENYGLFVFGFAFPGLFLIVVSLGMNSVLTIDVAADRAKAASYLTAIALLRIPLLLASLAILVVAMEFALPDASARTIAIILGASVILGEYANTFSTVFSAFERFEYVALVGVAERIVTTTAVLALLLLGWGLLHVAVVHFLGSLLILLLSLAVLKRRFVWFNRKVDPQLPVAILRKSAPFAASVAVVAVMNASAPVLATVLGGLTVTGLLNAANTLVTALLAPLSIYASVSLPVMSRVAVETPRKLPDFVRISQRLAFGVGLPIAVGGWFYAEDIVTLFYGSGFRDAAPSFGILVFGIAIATATLGTGTVLAATKRQRYNVIAAVVQTFMIIALCSVLIPPWGPAGAAAALLVSGAVAATLVTAFVIRYVTKLALVRTLLRPIVASGAMLALLYLLRPPLWLGVALGAGLYFAVLFIVRGMTRDDLHLVRQALRGVVPRRSGRQS